MNKSVKVNVNDRARIKLNERGRMILKSSDHIVLEKVDEDGYLETSLWEIMLVFGPHLYMGPPTPIHKNIIEIWPESR